MRLLASRNRLIRLRALCVLITLGILLTQGSNAAMVDQGAIWVAYLSENEIRVLNLSTTDSNAPKVVDAWELPRSTLLEDYAGLTCGPSKQLLMHVSEKHFGQGSVSVSARVVYAKLRERRLADAIAISGLRALFPKLSNDSSRIAALGVSTDGKATIIVSSVNDSSYRLYAVQGAGAPQSWDKLDSSVYLTVSAEGNRGRLRANLSLLDGGLQQLGSGWKPTASPFEDLIAYSTDSQESLRVEDDGGRLRATFDIFVKDIVQWVSPDKLLVVTNQSGRDMLAIADVRTGKIQRFQIAGNGEINGACVVRSD